MSNFEGKGVRERKAYADKVKRTANTTQKVKAGSGGRKQPAQRNRKAAQVMVKVSGYCKDGGRAVANIRYITRHGKLALENERGEKITGKDFAEAYGLELADAMGLDTSKTPGRRHAARLIFSMPEGTRPDKVLSATRATCQKQFAGHQYAIVLHTDTDKPHCHVLLMLSGDQGQRVSTRPGDLRTWREEFAQQLVARGVPAQATSLRARGKLKPLKNEDLIQRVVDGDKTHRPGRSRVDKAIREEAARELQGQQSRPEPWRKSVKARQERAIRAAVEAAAMLENPKPRFKRVDGKPLKNELPNYSGQDPIQVRRIQAAAASVHESRSGRAASVARARAYAGMQRVPGRDVASHRGHAALLLPLDAHDHLSERFEHSTNLLLRRTGAGVARDASGGRVVSDRVALARREPFKPGVKDVMRAAAWREEADSIEFKVVTRKDIHKAAIVAQQASERPQRGVDGVTQGPIKAGPVAPVQEAGGRVLEVRKHEILASGEKGEKAPAPLTKLEQHLVDAMRHQGFNERQLAQALAHVRERVRIESVEAQKAVQPVARETTKGAPGAPPVDGPEAPTNQPRRRR